LAVDIIPRIIPPTPDACNKPRTKVNLAGANSKGADVASYLHGPTAKMETNFKSLLQKPTLGVLL
jgi:hypothetical protein